MAAIGSAFLGDFKKLRIISSTPPSSPPPSNSPHTMSTLQDTTHSHISDIEDVLEPLDDDARGGGGDKTAKTAVIGAGSGDLPPAMETAHPVIDPALSLELRLRWLEALLLGVRTDPKDRKAAEKISERKQGETLLRLAENVQRRLDSVLDSNDGLRRFMDHYDRHAHLLTPAFALSGTLPSVPSYENMSPEELDALLTEMEPDIRAADRDMREIEILEKKGVTGAGKLADYQIFQSRVDAVLAAHRENAQRAISLEKRVAALMQRHATHIDALSELFVAWDDVLSSTEHKVSKLERERGERVRLGYE